VAIVGISGSPIQGGNTDRLVQSLLEQSDREYRFVDLSALDFVPCRGCAHLKRQIMGRDAKRLWRLPTAAWTLARGSRYSTASSTGDGASAFWSRSSGSDWSPLKNEAESR